MYAVVDASGELITCAWPLEKALSLLRRLERARAVWTDDYVVKVAFKDPRDFTNLVYFGRDAGAPRGIESAWVS